jgi:HK97 gp10 family phage protein
MSTNLSQFINEINTEKNKIEDSMSKIIKDIVRAIFDKTLLPKQSGGAPKKTGWLRSNIFVNINNSILDTVGSKRNVDVTKRNRLFNIFINTPTRLMLNSHNIYITYTVPYAKYVNDGTSKISPQKFKEKALQKGEVVLRNSRII